jgi:anti-sigma factor RsiW
MTDPIVDADLNAYVDDQLDVSRRIQVEAYLSEHPTVAAQVMADLRVKDELRLALAGADSAPRPGTREAARRLEGALARRRVYALFQRAAVVTLFIGAGWFAHERIGPLGATKVAASTQAPAYVSEAIAAHETAQLRQTADWQKPSREFDAAALRAATAITLPELPKGWRVVDAQIFPSANGPSVEVALAAGEGRMLSLFAERPGNFAVEPVQETHTAEARAAYWQIGDVAYALVADKSEAASLEATARKLAETLY